MNLDEILQKAATTFSNSNLSGEAGSGLDTSNLASALSNLVGGEGKGLDLSSLLSGMQEGGLGSIMQSWLGDGANSAISPDQISNLFGSDKISEFASQLGLSSEEAVGGLSEAVPEIVDNSSSGGSLLDSIGGVSGALGIAKKLFG
ncbi:MAG: YidB family protein [Thermodesulfobacteriota bacterium]